MVSTKVAADFAVSREVAFRHDVPIDLTTIFTGYWFLPAVIRTENQTGAWDSAGQTRTNILSNGGSSKEMIDKYDFPSYFSYRVSDFTGSFGRLVSYAQGEFWFTGVSPNETHVTWRYAFTAKSKVAAPVLWLITKTFWRSYMRQVLRRSREQVERIKEPK